MDSIVQDALKFQGKELQLKKVDASEITKVILLKIWYIIGLFTVIYLGLLIYDKNFGLNPASNYTALIVTGIAIGISVIDMVLLLNEKLSPAILAAVLWVSPAYVLYKLYNGVELLNLDPIILPKRLKYYATVSLSANILLVITKKSQYIESQTLNINESFKGLVIDALRYQEIGKLKKNYDVNDFGKPKIVVVGCGGGGNNTVNRLYNIGVVGAETIAINTDKIHLDITQADKKILFGKSITRGLGAGGFPEIGKRAAELARGQLEEALKDANLVFITAGMGGGTGTGAAPVVAQIAKDQGAIVIGIVTSPFRVERARMVKAEEGLEELRNVADTVIVLDNNRLLDYVPNLPIDQAFSVMDQLIAEFVKGITEAITQPSIINLDYANVRAIMKSGGIAVLLVGEAKGKDKVKEAVKAALNHPLLDVDTKGATGCLLHITGGPDLSLREVEEITSSLTYELNPHANVIWSATVREDFKDKVRCFAIMTGIKSSQVLGPKQSLDTEFTQTIINQRSDVD